MKNVTSGPLSHSKTLTVIVNQARPAQLPTAPNPAAILGLSVTEFYYLIGAIVGAVVLSIVFLIARRPRKASA